MFTEVDGLVQSALDGYKVLPPVACSRPLASIPLLLSPCFHPLASIPLLPSPCSRPLASVLLFAPFASADPRPLEPSAGLHLRLRPDWQRQDVHDAGRHRPGELGAHPPCTLEDTQPLRGDARRRMVRVAHAGTLPWNSRLPTPHSPLPTPRHRSWTLTASFCEIYNESLRDLLHTGKEAPPSYAIKHDEAWGTVVANMGRVEVTPRHLSRHLTHHLARWVALRARS